jgi:cytosine permease
MSEIDKITEDYSREQVPNDHAVHGIRIAMVIIGFAITLPLMLTGSRLGLSLGLVDAVIAFGAGGFLLTLLGVFTAIVGASARLSTYKIIEIPFGVLGAKGVNLVLALTLFGWYGVTAALFGQATYHAVMDLYGISLPVNFYTVLGSLLMISITVFGFKALDRFSLWVVPLLLLFLVSMVVFSMKGHHVSDLYTGLDDVGMGVAISVVVGSYIVGATLIPDLCRYAKTARHGVLAVIISLGVALPLILSVSAIPSLATGNGELVEIMMRLGMGLPALLMIVFATWTSNANNLYSTSLGLATIFTRTAKWKLTVIAGVICTGVAVSGITSYFIPFLLALGVAVPPIAGIYIADYFFGQGRQVYQQDRPTPREGIGFLAYAVWGVSVCVATASARDWIHLTGIPACDSLIVALMLYVLMYKLCGFPRSSRQVHDAT